MEVSSLRMYVLIPGVGKGRRRRGGGPGPVWVDTLPVPIIVIVLLVSTNPWPFELDSLVCGNVEKDVETRGANGYCALLHGYKVHPGWDTARGRAHEDKWWSAVGVGPL